MLKLGKMLHVFLGIWHETTCCKGYLILYRTTSHLHLNNVKTKQLLNVKRRDMVGETLCSN